MARNRSVQQRCQMAAASQGSQQVRGSSTPQHSSLSRSDEIHRENEAVFLSNLPVLLPGFPGSSKSFLFQ